MLVQHQAEPEGEYIFRPFDLLVLSIGLAPNENNAALAALVGLELDEHGFIRAVPGKDEKGVFLAGCVTRPMDVAEVVAHAGRAAEETMAYLERS